MPIYEVTSLIAASGKFLSRKLDFWKLIRVFSYKELETKEIEKLLAIRRLPSVDNEVVKEKFKYL